MPETLTEEQYYLLEELQKRKEENPEGFTEEQNTLIDELQSRVVKTDYGPNPYDLPQGGYPIPGITKPKAPAIDVESITSGQSTGLQPEMFTQMHKRVTPPDQDNYMGSSSDVSVVRVMPDGTIIPINDKSKLDLLLSPEIPSVNVDINDETTGKMMADVQKRDHLIAQGYKLYNLSDDSIEESKTSGRVYSEDREAKMLQDIQEDGGWKGIWHGLEHAVYKSASALTLGKSKEYLPKPELTEFLEIHAENTPLFEDDFVSGVARTVLGTSQLFVDLAPYSLVGGVLSVTKLNPYIQSAITFATVGVGRDILDPEINKSWQEITQSGFTSALLGGAFPILGRAGGSVLNEPNTAKAIGKFAQQVLLIESANMIKGFTDQTFSIMQANPEKTVGEAIGEVADFYTSPEGRTEILHGLVTMAFLHGTGVHPRFLKGGKAKAELGIGGSKLSPEEVEILTKITMRQANEIFELESTPEWVKAKPKTPMEARKIVDWWASQSGLRRGVVNDILDVMDEMVGLKVNGKEITPEMVLEMKRIYQDSYDLNQNEPSRANKERLDATYDRLVSFVLNSRTRASRSQQYEPAPKELKSATSVGKPTVKPVVDSEGRTELTTKAYTVPKEPISNVAEPTSDPSIIRDEPKKLKKELKVERSERKTINPKNVKLSAVENKKISIAVEGTNFNKKEITSKVQLYKSKHPLNDGWARLEINKVDTSKKNPKVEYKKIPYTFQKYKGKATRKGSPAYNRMITSLGKKAFNDFVKVMERAKAGDKNAQAIIEQATWYAELKVKIHQQYGGQTQLFGEILGATSPQTPVSENFKNALEIIETFTKGGYDDVIKKYIEYIEADGDPSSYEGPFPTKSTGAKYGTNSKAVLDVLTSNWILIEPGSSPKAKNFALNILGKSKHPTIDVWSARAWQRRSGGKRIPVQAEQGVTGKYSADGTYITGQFGVGGDGYRYAEQKLKEMGIEGFEDTQSIDLQAVDWFLEKENWTENNWTTVSGEGGSFEDNLIVEYLPKYKGGGTKPRDYDRHQVGHSIQQLEEPTKVNIEKARERLKTVASNDNNIRAIRYEDSKGLYTYLDDSGEVVPDQEKSFDTELTVEKGHVPVEFYNEVLKISKENNQVDTFFSKVLRENEVSENARPGIEVEFKNPLSESEVEGIVSFIRDRGHDGFTLSREKRNKEGLYTGIRLQIIPEITARYNLKLRESFKDPKFLDNYIEEKSLSLDIISDELSQRNEVEDSYFYSYITEVVGKENINEFIQETPKENRRTFWQGSSLGQETQNAIQRYEEAERKLRPPTDRNKSGEEESYQITAFHGSPHKFDQFDSYHIGTGEGNQAFGYGLYFSSKKDIAEHYARNLASIKPNDVIDALSDKQKLDFIKKHKLDDSDLGPNLYLKLNVGNFDNAMKNELVKLSGIEKRNVYNVTLHKGKDPSEYDYLRWADKPTPEQVLKINRQWKKDYPAIEIWFNDRLKNASGAVNYMGMAEELEISEKEVSAFLLRAGIDGIRYPAQGGTGGRFGDSENFVVFDDSAVTIDKQESFQLSPQQKEHFKESVIRDENGDLIKVTHITDQSFDEFKYKESGFHFGVPSINKNLRRLKGKSLDVEYEGYLNIKNPIRISDRSTFHPDGVLKDLYDQGIITENDYDQLEGEIFEAYDADDGITEASNILNDFLLGKGYDGFVYENSMDDTISSIKVLLDPTNNTAFVSRGGEAFSMPIAEGDSFKGKSPLWVFSDGEKDYHFTSSEGDLITSKAEKNRVKELLNKNDGRVIDAIAGETIEISSEDFVNPPKPTDSYIAFNSNQFKLAENIKPTDSPSISYQLSPLEPMGIKDRIERGVIDKLNRLKSVQDQIENLPEDQDAIQVAETIHGTISTQIENFRKLVYEDENSILNQAKVDGYSIEDLGEYLYAKHAKERNKAMKLKNPDLKTGSGMTNKKANEILNKWKGTGIHKHALKIWKHVTKEALLMRYKGGLIDKATYDKLKKSYKNYVPLKGTLETEGATSYSGKGFNTPGTGIMGAYGRESIATNPLVQALVDYESAVRIIEQNKVGQAFLRMAQANESSMWSIAKRKHKPAYDADGEVSYIPKDLSTDELQTFADGKRYVIRINDKDLLRAMKNLEGTKSNTALQLLNKFNAYFRAVNTSYSPEFPITNFSRDLQTAMAHLTSDQKAKVPLEVIKNVKKAMGGIRSSLRGDGSHEWSSIYEEFKLHGGKAGWMDFIDVADKFNDIESQLNKFEEGGATRKSVKYLKDLVENYNEMAENAVRLSTYKSMRDLGHSPKKSAHYAKDLTVNFNRKGELSTFVNTLYVFSTASIQGSNKIFRVMKSKKGKKIAGGLVATGFLLSLLNRWTDEEEWDQFSDYNRDNYSMFLLPNGKAVSLKLPYGWNWFFALGGSIEQTINGDTTWDELVKRTLKNALDAFAPISGGSFGQFITPTILDPWMQISENKNFFGGNIAKDQESFGNKIPQHQRGFKGVNPIIDKGTQELYDVADIDLNPEYIEHIIESYTGGLGKFSMNLLKTGRALIKKEDIPLNNVLFLRQVYKEKNSWKAKNKVDDLIDDAKTKVFSQTKTDRFYHYLATARENGTIDRKQYKKLRSKFKKNQKEARKR